MNQAEQDLLVLTAQDGNHRAFGLLVKLYHNKLYGFAFKLTSNRDVANDAVQNAWLKASKNLRKLKDPRAFKSWIYRLVRWSALDLVKKSNHDKKVLEEFYNEDFFSNEIENEFANSGLAELIEKLPNIEKQIIHLFYLDELTIKELSIILEIPVGTVKSRLFRARNLLKETVLSTGELL